MNMLIWTLLWHCITTEQNENAKCIKFKIYFFVHMHLISVKMGVVVFNRQLFINLDGPSIGVSLDISRQYIKWNQSHYGTYFVDFVRHQTSAPLIILSSVFRIISVTSTFTLWETYTTSVNLTNLKLVIFPIPLHSTINSALFSLSLSTAFLV